jgi:ABC-type dipeptide/oligopeptide/nickel transport system permease subunit
VTQTTTDEIDEPAVSWRRARWLWRRRSLAIGASLICLVVLAAVLAPLIARSPPDAQDLANSLMPPSAEHIFGTDGYGRDLFSRVVHGARISLLEILLGVGIAFGLGVPLGLLSGTVGGILDQAMMWVMDIVFAFPGVILAILIVSLLGPSLINMLVAIAIYSVPVYARLSRNLAMGIKRMEYVEAAGVLGAGVWRIVFDHILRNALGPIIVQATLTAGSVILTAASLSFLGLGAEPPLPEWGAMMSDGRNYMGVSPWLSLFPGLAVALTVLGCNMLGDGLRDLLDPRS